MKNFAGPLVIDTAYITRKLLKISFQALRKKQEKLKSARKTKKIMPKSRKIDILRYIYQGRKKEYEYQSKLEFL